MRFWIHLLSILCAASGADAARRTWSLEGDWQFLPADVKEGASPVFQDGDWQTLSIPHNWGFGKAQQGDRSYERGPAWYRRGLDFEVRTDHRYFVCFEAAASIADVYLNGHHLGQHRGGFSAFCYEMTSHLNPEGDNLLAVRVSNEKTDAVLPLSGDFNLYGGLYRPVQILETPLVCFDPTDHGSSGVHWRQLQVSREEAVIGVKAWISNRAESHIPVTWFPPEPGKHFKEARYRLVASLLDGTGETVARTEKWINLGKDVSAPHELCLNVRNPHLWQGVKDPYLYSTILEIETETGTCLDRITGQIGLRSVRIDPETGFHLNGEPYRLKGVCRHQDRKDQGWALSEAGMEEDLSLILEMGANAIRLAHYQHSSYFHQLCDEKGVLLYVEIPLVGTLGKNPRIRENARQQLLDLIRQNRNHSSIFTWGLFNELHLHYGGMDPVRTVDDLNKLAEAEDPDRPTIAATNNMAIPQLNRIPDLLGWNRYPGWYDPLEHLGTVAWDKYWPTSRRGGIALSEYGAGANHQHHEPDPEQPVPRGFWHPEEWQTLVHEHHWKTFKDTPWIWGTFVWNMFDFASANRREGGKKGLNDKGLVSFDRKIKKDAYFFYQANWSGLPVLHITGKRHNPRIESITTIKVYSNQGPVQLIVNGVLLGSAKPSEIRICEWPGISLKQGKNHIRVEAGNLVDEVIWTHDPAAPSVKPDHENEKRIGPDGGVAPQ